MNRHNLNEYWKTVVDSIQDGVMIVDPDGTIVSANRAFEEITGYSHKEILGKSCATLNCSSCQIAREENGCHWCVMFRKGNLSRQRCSLIRKDGRTVTILKNASVIKDSDGIVTGAVETMTDITDLVSQGNPNRELPPRAECGRPLSRDDWGIGRHAPRLRPGRKRGAVGRAGDHLRGERHRQGAGSPRDP